MRIQWYPGHMTKAMRMMQEQIGQVDCLIYVLDMRAVTSCLNPQFEKLASGKPILYALNKRDLVEQSDVALWEKAFAAQGKRCVSTDGTGFRHREKLIAELTELNRAVIDRYKAKGVRKTVRAMVVGVPNTGKSTLINSLCKSKKTVTGNKAGVTRGKQWVTLASGIELLDTPGTLPPSFDDPDKALKLAFIGSVKDEILDTEELAIEFIGYIRAHAPQAFEKRYGEGVFCETDHETLNTVAKKRGFVLSGGLPDTARAARAVIDDFRGGRMGRIMLDRPGEGL